MQQRPASTLRPAASARRSTAFAVLGLLGLVALAGCAPPRAPVVYTELERQLLTQLTRDPFIVVQAVTREADGFITVRTLQGDTVAWYRLMPAEGADTPQLRRVDDRQTLSVAWTDELGTGPAPRGLTRSFAAQ